MTVESTLTKRTYAGNGSATEFPVPFTYSRAEDLYLILTGADGTETPVSSNFRVDVNASGDASVIYPLSGAPLPAGRKLTIYRDTPQTQIVDLVYGGAFSPDVLEHDGFDRLEMQIQELDEALARSVKLPISSGLTPEELLEDIFGARGEAGTARDAARAAQSAAGQCRDDACACADRAAQARDVAILQAGATNELMAAEMAKINLIAGALRDDMQKIVDASEAAGGILAPDPGTLPLRGPRGELKAGAPDEADDVVIKNVFDAALAGKLDVSAFDTELAKANRDSSGAFPSGTSIILALPAPGGTVVAPGDGWLELSSNLSPGGGLSLFADDLPSSHVYYQSSGGGMAIHSPVRGGMTVNVNWTAASNPKLRFIPSVGNS